MSGAGSMRIFSRLFQPTSDRHTGKNVQVDDPGAATGERAFVSAIAEARTHREAGRLGEALRITGTALAKHPNDPALLFERAATLFAWGRYAESHQALLAAARAGVHSGALYAKLGWTCLWLSRIEEAADAMQRAVERSSDDWAAHFGQGTVLRAQQRTEDSRFAFERALALAPENPHVVSSLIACEIALERFESAERLARRAIELHPELPGAFADLGMAFCSQGRHAEAVAAFEHAESLETHRRGMGDDCVNFAICLLRAGMTGKALDMIERRLHDYPSTLLHAQYALALLTAGRFHEGWRQFEFRWIDEPLLSGRPNFVCPQWNGQDLRGKTILLWSEQGFGDFIQFIRYAAHVKALGATVVVLLRDGLRELAASMPAIDRILGPNEPYPPFDYYINLLSLPRVFGTDASSIPADVPYLHVDDVRSARWRERLQFGEPLKVGIVWAGSPTHLRDRFRSLSVQSLTPLLQLPGVRFFSLQKGPAAAPLTTAHSAVVDLAAELDSFADTAAAISHLDLVIGVDTAVVHLAGALGKPVWTLIAVPPDWRWMEARDDSPWYPTMRLFRQKSQGNWDDVVEQVKSALQDWLRHRIETRTSEVIVAHTRSPARPAIPVAHATASPDDLCQVAETRHGIMQYFPGGEEGRSMAFYGEWRQLQLEALNRLVTTGMTVLEAGAGIGCSALWLSRRVGPEGHVFLYENDPLRRQVLEQNLKANHVGNATLIRRRFERSDGNEPGDTLDDLQLERLDWLKVGDVRRALDVLEGAGETLWRLRPRLAFDMSDTDDAAPLTQRANDFGYGCWRMETPLHNAANFNRRDKDIFEGRMAAVLIALPEENGLDPGHDGWLRLK